MQACSTMLLHLQTKKKSFPDSLQAVGQSDSLQTAIDRGKNCLIFLKVALLADCRQGKSFPDSQPFSRQSAVFQTVGQSDSLQTAVDRGKNCLIFLKVALLVVDREKIV